MPVMRASLVLAATLIIPGCHQSPDLEQARLLERAASWASSVQLTSEVAQAGGVPRGYVHDVLRTGTREVAQIRSKVVGGADPSASVRSEPARLCDELVVLLQDAARSGRLPDRHRLEAIEGRLRALAHDARSRESR